MTALHISPDEIWLRFETAPEPPRLGASVKDWIAYRARAPRPALPAPVVKRAPAVVWELPPPKVKAVPEPTPVEPPPEAPDPILNYIATRLPVGRIIRTVAAHFNVRVIDVISERRTRDVLIPRHIAMFLAKELTTKSLPEIGRAFGGRDHTTILNAVRKVGRLVETDPGIRAHVEAIKAKLLGDVAA